jgi:hypothetical protein
MTSTVSDDRGPGFFVTRCTLFGHARVGQTAMHVFHVDTQLDGQNDVAAQDEGEGQQAG